MSFRRDSNHHDLWIQVVRENSALFQEMPACELESEQGFKDYVPSGTNRGRAVSPAISELSNRAIDVLWIFINHKAHFDMDAVSFELFNKVHRERYSLRKL